jgi:cob(I)alamin adenosyltransferase
MRILLATLAGVLALSATSRRNVETNRLQRLDERLDEVEKRIADIESTWICAARNEPESTS